MGAFGPIPQSAPEVRAIFVTGEMEEERAEGEGRTEMASRHAVELAARWPGSRDGGGRPAMEMTEPTDGRATGVEGLRRGGSLPEARATRG